jgi:hypothetical protein
MNLNKKTEQQKTSETTPMADEDVMTEGGMGKQNEEYYSDINVTKDNSKGQKKEDQNEESGEAGSDSSEDEAIQGS